MASSFNNVTIMGNLVKENELRTVGSNNTSVLDNTIAINERRKVGMEWVDEAHFIDVTFWGRNAEIVQQYLRKGSPVLVRGKLTQDKWDDAETGQKRSKVKVTVQEMRMVGGKQDEGSSYSAQPAAPAVSNEPPSFGGQQGDNDIPF